MAKRRGGSSRGLGGTERYAPGKARGASATSAAPRKPRWRGRRDRSFWDDVDWTLPTSVLAKQKNVSRQAVAYARIIRDIPAPPPVRRDTPGTRFREYVEGRRDELHGELVKDVVAASGQAVSWQTAKRVLREAGVRPAEPGRRSELRQVNWELPNRDLADIWGVGVQVVTNARHLWNMGPAKWDARRRDTDSNPAYKSAIRKERQKAGKRDR